MKRPDASAAEAGRLLLHARRSGIALPALPPHCVPVDVAQAYAIQDWVAGSFGSVGGWKVGAKGAQATPTCAPIPGELIRANGSSIPAPECRLRGAELELAVRMGADLPPRGQPYSREEVASALSAVMPVIEVVDSRFQDMAVQPPLSLLADCASNAGLVLGAEAPGSLPRDPARQAARLAFEGHIVADTIGGNAAGDLLALLTWLANHLPQRGTSLRRGQVVTTGTWTGVLFAPPGASVEAELAGYGRVELRFREAAQDEPSPRRPTISL
jgi:2-keto-4-pentenoate hydratase